MAGRFDFQSPGFNIASTIRMILDKDIAEEMRQKELAQQAEDLKLRQSADARANADLALRQGADKRAADTLAAVTRRNTVADLEAEAARAGVDGAVSPEFAAQAPKLAPSMMRLRPQPTPMLPNAGTPEGSGLPPVEQGSMILPGATPPPEIVSAGSKRQQVFKQLRERPDLTEAQRTALDLVEASGDNNIPSSLAELFAGDGGDKRLFRRTSAGDVEESIPGKGWTKHEGAVPKNSQFVVEPNQNGNTPAPYFMFMGSDQGIVKGNARTGELTPTGVGNKPGAGSQQRMVDMSAALSQIQLLKDDFNPEYVGPLEGRFENVYTRLINSPNKAALARFQTRVASLKNRFIKAITGAQMSEPEAVRIMSQLPDLNLPDSTFLARLDVSEQELGNILDIEQQVASGVRKPTESPVTEAALNRLFPDSKFTGPAKAADAKAPAAAAPGTKKSAADLIKQYGSGGKP